MIFIELIIIFIWADNKNNVSVSNRGIQLSASAKFTGENNPKIYGYDQIRRNLRSPARIKSNQTQVEASDLD